MIVRALVIGLAALAVFNATDGKKSTALAQTNTENTSAESTPTNSIAPETNDITSIEQAVLEQINQYRQQKNLPTLKLDERISSVARVHSTDMASGQVAFGHDGFEQRANALSEELLSSATAENVAYNGGYIDPATVAVKGWLNSSGHRQNIEGEYDLTGIGVAVNERGEYYFTQIFVRSRSE